MTDDRCITTVLEWNGTLKSTLSKMTDLSYNEMGNSMLKRRQNYFSGKVWFASLAVMILLVIGGVKMNLGPQVEQVKIHQILMYIKKPEEKRRP
jgi:hypothetical protein